MFLSVCACVQRRSCRGSWTASKSSWSTSLHPPRHRRRRHRPSDVFNDVTGQYHSRFGRMTTFDAADLDKTLRGVVAACGSA